MPDPRATSQFCAFYSFTGILFMVRVFSCSNVLVSWNNNDQDCFVRMTAHPSVEDRGIGKCIRYCFTPCTGMATRACKIRCISDNFTLRAYSYSSI